MILELKEVSKVFKLSKKEDYIALNDVNLSFEKGEFVSVVGPSGSGKSTLLNLIAGLDFPTGGELVIGDKSSKKFKMKDWDRYRKNNIGFIFQNFNLIEHLTAIENVEIVMNLIGISYLNRRKRAMELLKKVGLENHMYHKPSELSGGQKQRVAIARALANDPDIILADEPTGALDSKTGKQIMELIKSIASDKLVIMVTHNEQLANEYSTRIVKVKDGKIESDNNIKEAITNNRKSSLSKKDKVMSFFEAFKLSIRNMAKKKGRVAITTTAGCIGIIGFTLITGLGNGANIYIDKQLNKFATANVLVLSKTISDDNNDSHDSSNNKYTKDYSDFDNILNDEYIKENISVLRKHISITSLINVNLNTDNLENTESINGFSFYSLADDNNLDFLKENIQGDIPVEGENQLLLNQASARKILNKLNEDSNDITKVIGKTITLTINIGQTNLKYDKEFKVTGIVNEIDLGIQNIYIRYSDIENWTQSINLGDKTYYDYLTSQAATYEIVVSDVNNTKAVADYINDKSNGGVGKISLMSSNTQKVGNQALNIAIVVKQIFAQVILIAQIVISIFIIVALVVSAIMTSIVLYSSIVERKTEIGIIKAVGGRNKDVIRIFESEAMLMGILSGVFGIIISFVLAPILEKVISNILNIDLPGIITIPISKVPFTDITFPFATIIVIILFSTLVSFIAGYLPSRKATKMQVIDALRDE